MHRDAERSAGDLSTIKARLMLLDAARGLRERGITPAGSRDPSVYRVRGASKTVPDNLDWFESTRDAVTIPEK